MKTAIVSVILACLTVSMSAQSWRDRGVEVPFTFRNILPNKTSAFGFTAAANIYGTVDIDTLLKEQEIPSLPPPAGVFIVYSVPPTPDYKWISPIDIRPLTEGKQYVETYEIGVTWNGGTLEIERGQGYLNEYVDSVYITDVITDFPDNFIKKKMDVGTVYSTSNSAITKLRIMVWYDARVVSVLSDVTTTAPMIYPQPAESVLWVKGATNGSSIRIVDIAGNTRETLENVTELTGIDLSMLETGTYLAVIREPLGAIHSSMFIHR
ncbi:MAG: T9SS type A sorting domain-containing protein [Candidatus Kapabacteria bacterium]|nr:T9SS type A sorting domain-containing protein [Candidatus Kapabacteria bacterium]